MAYNNKPNNNFGKNNNNGNNAGREKEYFRSAALFCHDSNLTIGVMTSMYGEMSAFLRLARRLPDAPAEAKKGDKIYDHNNEVFIALGVNQAIRLQAEINYLEASEKSQRAVFMLGIWKLEFIKGEYLEHPIKNAIFMSIENTDTKQRDAFVFENKPISLDNIEGQQEGFIFVQDFEIFKQWLQAVIPEMFKPHKMSFARMGQPTGQGARTSAAGNHFKQRPSNSNQTSQETQQEASNPQDYVPQGEDQDLPF